MDLVCVRWKLVHYLAVAVGCAVPVASLSQPASISSWSLLVQPALSRSTAQQISSVDQTVSQSNADSGDNELFNWWQRFRQMRSEQEHHIAAYRGYGNAHKIWLRGRVLADRLYGGPQDDDNWWDNLKATYGRWETDEVANAKVSLSYAGDTIVVTTDAEGYYEAEFSRNQSNSVATSVIARYRHGSKEFNATHWIMIPNPRAKYLIVSDVDDTVIHTGITELLLSAQLTFLNNAKTRKPLAGVASLYRALAYGWAGQSVNPIIYLSNSAWNMFDLLRDFMTVNDLPRGPLLLRDIGLFDVLRRKSNHKLDTLRILARRFRGLPLILVGDSGQHDAEIYQTIASEFPDRVLAIYIRDIDPENDSEFDYKVDEIFKRDRVAGVPMLRVSDSLEVASHAVELGLIPSSALPQISRDAVLDGNRNTLGVESLGPGRGSQKRDKQ